MSDLSKSVREVSGCGSSAMGHGHALAWANTCDACLWLVLAHCGERAAEEVEGRSSMFIQNDRLNRRGAYQVADAIRREFGCGS